MHHCFCDHEAAAHSAGERAGVGVGFVGKAYGVEDVHCVALGLWYAVEAGLEFQYLAGGEEGVVVEFLGDDADGAFGVADVLINVDVPDFNTAGCLYDEAGHDVDHG